MSTTTSTKAERQGRLWGLRPRGWAESEERQLPTYEAALRRVGVDRGARVLDLGCGAGTFLRLAAERGAEVTGLDASPGLIELARERIPSAELRVGEIDRLPFADDAFDLVTGFNSFFFAADMVAALREAGRVTKDGARVLIQIWGNPEHNDIETMKGVAAKYMPAESPSKGPARTELWKPGVLEDVACEAGLRPEDTFDVRWTYEYANEDEFTTAMLSAGGLSVLVGPEGESTVKREIAEALASTRQPDGSHRLQNESHFLVCRA